MWETKPRMTPQKTSRLLMGSEQVTRPKNLQPICSVVVVVVTTVVVVVVAAAAAVVVVVRSTVV